MAETFYKADRIVRSVLVVVGVAGLEAGRRVFLQFSRMRFTSLK
nr:MAG TPA: hypothetical protein [Caudoviricetes sp.]